MKLVVHTDLIVRDMDASLAFYTEQLGFVVAEDTIVEGAAPAFYSAGTAKSMRLVMLQSSSLALQYASMIELLELRPKDEPRSKEGPRSTVRGRVKDGAPSIRNLAFAVRDLEATLEELKQWGTLPVSEIIPIDLPKLGKSKIVFIQDPDDNLIELIEALPEE